MLLPQHESNAVLVVAAELAAELAAVGVEAAAVEWEYLMPLADSRRSPCHWQVSRTPAPREPRSSLEEVLEGGA